MFYILIYNLLSGLVMIDVNIDRIAYETTLTHFSDEVIDKEIEVANLQMNFINKFQGVIKSLNHHPQLIRHSTKILSQIDKIMKDIQYHFKELRLDFAFDLFDRIFKVLISGYKMLSQAYLYRYQDQKQLRKRIKETSTEQKINQREEQSVRDEKNSGQKNNYRKIQALNFILDQLEKKDHQIEEQLKSYHEEIKIQKDKIRKTMPSNACQKITEIQATFEQIIKRTEEIFVSMFQVRHDELKKFMYELERPERISDLFCSDLRNRIKFYFLEGMEKTVIKIHNNFKKKQVQKLKNQYKKKQNEAENANLEHQKKKQKNLADKKKMEKLSHQNEKLKKQIQSFELQIRTMNEELAEFDKKIIALKRENQTLESLLKKKDMENEKHKKQIQWEINVRNIKIQKLLQKIQETAQNTPVKNQIFHQDAQTELNMEQLFQLEEEIDLMRTNSRKKSIVPFRKINDMERKLEFQMSNTNSLKSSLINLVQKVNFSLDLSDEVAQLEEKLIDSIGKPGNVNKLVEEWCEKIKILSKSFIKNHEQFPKDESIKNQRKQERTSRYPHTQSRRFDLRNTGTQTQNVNTNLKPYITHRPLNRLALDKDFSLKKSSSKLINQQKQIKTTRSKNLIRSDINRYQYDTQDENIQSNHKRKNNYSEIFNKASFQQIRISSKKKSHMKTRTSKVGLYLTAYSSRKKEPKKTLVQEIKIEQMAQRAEENDEQY